MIYFAKKHLVRTRFGIFLKNKIAILNDLFFSSIGQLLSQLLTIAAMPIITRIFTAHDIGMQGLFVSTSGLFSSFVALGFPYAIVLPAEDRDARTLLRLSIYAALISGIALEIFLYLFGHAILKIIGVEELNPYRHLVTIGSILTAISLSYTQYFIRQRRYREQSAITLANSVVLNGGRIATGFISRTAIGLIWINIIAMIAMVGQYAIRWRRRFGHLFVREDFGHLRWLARRYYDFPLLRMPQIVINAASQALPLWLLAGYYGAASAGQYAMAISLLSAPTGLIGKSISDVFYPRLAAAYRAGVSPRPLIVKATLVALALVILPYAIIVVFGPEIFRFAFGHNWGLAGEYGRWLSLFCMLQIVNRPAVAATFVLHIQGGLLIYELFSTGTKIAALWIGFMLFHDGIVSVALFSIAGIIAYIFLILWVIFRSKNAYESNTTPA